MWPLGRQAPGAGQGLREIQQGRLRGFQQRPLTKKGPATPAAGLGAKGVPAQRWATALLPVTVRSSATVTVRGPCSGAICSTCRPRRSRVCSRFTV